MCMTLAIRHNLPWTVIVDIFKMMNNLFGNDETLPNSKYKVLQYFPVEKEMIKCHIYCLYCERYLGEKSNASFEKICPCGKSEQSADQYFLSLNFQSQFKQLLENPNIRKSLLYRFERKKRHKDAIEDIYDGKCYKILSAPGQPLSYTWNFSYTFNTDGCKSANSSKATVWPIYASINELPPNMRSKHMILIGIWVNKKEPNMNVFLQPFVHEANFLSKFGIQWNLNGKTVVSKILPLICCVDSVARASMLSMKQFNGKYGCTFCEHPTESVDGYIKYTVSTVVSPNRTDAGIKRNMIRAHEYLDSKQNYCNGIKGPTVLMNLKYFDLANGMIPDSLHALYLGVIRQYTEIIMTSSDKEYYIGSPAKINIINNRLKNITPPKYITRTPRTLDERKLWKGSEWRSWANWYILPCLQDMMPKKYIEHLALLVAATNILLQDSISENVLAMAENLLIKFVICMQQYFGKASMTYNVHLLLHLCNSVKNWGPVWINNTFLFENENRCILLLKTSPNNVALQICRKFLHITNITSFVTQLSISTQIRIFCEKLVKKRIKYSKVEDCILIGSGKQQQLDASEEACLGITTASIYNCTTFTKIIYKGNRYTSQKYKRYIQTNDSFFQHCSGEFGFIKNFVEIEQQNVKQILLLYKPLHVQKDYYLKTKDVIVNHIIQCNSNIEDAVLKCTPVQCISGPSLVININNMLYVSNVPRGCLGD